MLHRPNFHRGFTLVELLVVVAIIVVLLALLTTALSAAIYQAELATCAAGQRSIATSTLTYAMGHRRSYPHRPGALEAEYWMPSLIYDPGLFSTSSAGGIAFDDRFALRQFLSVNASLNDPLAAAVDFENSDAVLLVGYHLWFGFRYYGQRGMLRPVHLRAAGRPVHRPPLRVPRHRPRCDR
jgi:prepilin-type N-terminal cleavage/methylation domain-containing protein